MSPLTVSARVQTRVDFSPYHSFRTMILSLVHVVDFANCASRAGLPLVCKSSTASPDTSAAKRSSNGPRVHSPLQTDDNLSAIAKTSKTRPQNTHSWTKGDGPSTHRHHLKPPSRFIGPIFSTIRGLRVELYYIGFQARLIMSAVCDVVEVQDLPRPLVMRLLIMGLSCRTAVTFNTGILT